MQCTAWGRTYFEEDSWGLWEVQNRWSLLLCHLQGVASALQLVRVQQCAPSWMEGCGRGLKTLPGCYRNWHQDIFNVCKLVMGGWFSLRFESLSSQELWDYSGLHQKWFARSQGYLDFTDLVFCCARFHADIGIKCFYLARKLDCILLHLSYVPISSS